MSTIGWATLDVIPSVRGLRGELEKQTGPGLAAAGVTGGRAFGDSAGREASSRFGSAMRKTAKVAAIGLAAGAAAAFKFGGDALEEAREAQKVGAQTDAVIKSTGKAAKVTAKEVGRLSGRLSDKAGIDDELIQSGANVLLTFKNIRNESGKGNKIFDQAAKSALDMSVALGTDMSGASIQLGKALNDPVKGVTALGRAGVQFSEDQKAAIKKMVESGDTLGAQKIILKELDDQFKGSAKAQATEADKLGVAFGNLKEDVGTALIPVMDDLAVFLRKKGIPAARDFAGWVRDDLAPAVKQASEDVKPLTDGVKDLAKFFGDLPTTGKISALGGALAGGLVIKHQLGKVFERGGIGNPMFVVVTNPGGLGADDIAGGKAGKWVSLGKAFGTAAGIAILAASIKNVDNLLDDAVQRHPDAKPKDFSDGVMNDGYIDFGKDWDKAKEDVVTLSSKVNGLNDALFLVGNKKIRPQMDDREIILANKRLGEFISKKVDAGQPITPYVNTTSIERAITLVNALADGMHGVPTAGTDGGAPFVSGAGSRAGVTFTGPISVKSNNPREFAAEVDRRTRDRAMGGRG